MSFPPPPFFLQQMPASYLEQGHGASLVRASNHLLADQVGVGCGDGGDPGLNLRLFIIIIVIIIF